MVLLGTLPEGKVHTKETELSLNPFVACKCACWQTAKSEVALASVFAGFSSVVVELSCKNKLRCTRHKIAHEAKCHHVPVVVLLQLPALFQLWLHLNLLLVPEGKVHTLGMSHFLHAHIRTLKTTTYAMPLWLQAFLQ